MKIEIQLPPGNLDPRLRSAADGLELARIGEEARLAWALGYDGIVTEDDPFPRAPGVAALASWTWQHLAPLFAPPPI